MIRRPERTLSFEELEIDDFRTLQQIASFVAAKQAAPAKSRGVSATPP